MAFWVPDVLCWVPSLRGKFSTLRVIYRRVQDRDAHITVLRDTQINNLSASQHQYTNIGQSETTHMTKHYTEIHKQTLFGWQKWQAPIFCHSVKLETKKKTNIMLALTLTDGYLHSRLISWLYAYMFHVNYNKAHLFYDRQCHRIYVMQVLI